MEVVFIYKYLPQYRIDFFQKLKDELLNYGVNLRLVYGKSKGEGSLRGDEVDLDWAIFVPNKVYKIGKIELVWQPVMKHVRSADLVIIQPEMKLLLNYFLMFQRKFQKYKLGFWGHGRNMQGKPDSSRNKFNNLFLNKCDWWFAYTQSVGRYLVDHHFPKDKITVVQNAIDIASLKKYYNQISDDEVFRTKQILKIKGTNTGIFCGGMYPEKRLDFLISTARKIKEEVPDFNLILLGAGVDSVKAKEASEKFEWIHYLGAKFGEERILYFKLACIQLMPGLVGLGILDSFAFETPIVTTDYPFHSPEIDYLKNWENGVMTENNLESYANTVIKILKEKSYFNLIEGCKKSSEIFTIQNMVDNFKEGILSCIAGTNNFSIPKRTGILPVNNAN